MGVYIKGMTMPKAPNDCPFCDYEQGMCLAWLKVNEDDYFRACYNYPDKGERFPGFCPLIEVPDHGRLIDADDIMAELGSGVYWWETEHEVPGLLNEIPTIIPADRSGE